VFIYRCVVQSYKLHLSPINQASLRSAEISTRLMVFAQVLAEFGDYNFSSVRTEVRSVNVNHIILRDWVGAVLHNPLVYYSNPGS
jgi:hypothetical protein